MPCVPQHEGHVPQLVPPMACDSIKLPSVRLIFVPDGSTTWVEMSEAIGSAPMYGVVERCIADGSPVPLCCLTAATSPALMLPFALTSLRKLAAVTACPLWLFVCAMSAAFT